MFFHVNNKSSFSPPCLFTRYFVCKRGGDFLFLESTLLNHIMPMTFGTNKTMDSSTSILSYLRFDKYTTNLQNWFVFSSPELKAQVSFSDRLLPGVRLSVCPSVNFYTFDFFSRTTGPILTRLGTNHPWVKGIQVCSNERDSPSVRGDNRESVKIQWKFLKIFFSRTSRPN
jgi:hypothetical protein